MTDGPKQFPKPFQRQPFADWRARMATSQKSQVRSLLGFIVLLILMLVFVVLALPYVGRRDTWLDPQRAAQAQEKTEGYVVPTQDPQARAARDELRKQELAKQFDGALVEVPNGADFKETDGYRRLVKYFLDHTPEAGKTPEDIPYLDLQPSVADPLAWQGKYVRLRGVAVKKRTRLDVSVWNQADVWRVFVHDLGSGRAVIDLVVQPPAFVEEKDAVEVEGLFYRTVTYTPGANEDTRITLPYLIGKTLRVIQAKPAGVPGFLEDWGIYAFVFALAVAWGIYRVFRLVRGGREVPTSGLHKTDFRKIFDDKLRAAGRGPTAAPPS